ncbi:unnamed protein product [Tetraodon nigroviridis]|uniref:(spotted green pufferfish) hypothetical protein n=1 Tax=Tetraodon nigroviridis TaxID=99883 RepID=Q4RFF6_TETNG|nr:unnamed protein product [Tetraodon nigroviridis]
MALNRLHLAKLWYSKRVERVFFQERDLRVGGHKRHAALPLRLPFRYHIDRDDLRRSQRGPSHDFKAIHIVCVLLSNTGAALLFPGHTLRWVMWFRVSAEGRREFAHHTDPNQISLSYRGRTRYVGGSYSSCSFQIRVVKLSDAGDYHFRFETDQPLGRWTSPDTVRLDVTDLQVQVHPARHANTYGFGETVFVGCQARGCAAPGRNLALYRNGLNLGSYEKWMVIHRFDRPHAGAYTCRPIPPQKVHSPPVSLALGCGYKWMEKTDNLTRVLCFIPTSHIFFLFCCPADAPHFTSITVFPAGEATEGGSVTLTCSSDAAPPAESFAWFKDMDSGSIPDSFRPQLHLSHLKYTDRGEYFCVARNSLGTDRSSSFLLNVTCESAGCFQCSCRPWLDPPHVHCYYSYYVSQKRSRIKVTVLVSDSPKDTQVLVIPPGDIREGLYVNLSCINKANPPANRLEDGT